MLKNILYLFPENDKSDFFKILKSILLELPNSRESNQEVILISSFPANGLPRTTFRTANISSPQIIFEMDSKVFIPCSPLIIASEIHSSENVLTSHSNTQSQLLSIRELSEKLKNHIVRIDHTGVNLPKKMVSNSAWNTLITALSTESAIYNYPEVSDWKFILPAIEFEQKKDIKEFFQGREPKFELVYDSYSDIPCVQIDIQTNLTREETEKLFPDPYGVSFPDLADFFRTVYVSHKWQGLLIRFDLRFKSSKGDLDWNTGKWLVQDGGRIK